MITSHAPASVVSSCAAPYWRPSQRASAASHVSGGMIRGHSKRGRSKNSKVKHLRATAQLLRFNRCKLITMALQQLKSCETSTQK